VAVARVAFAAARDDARPVLTAVLFDFGPDGLTLAAADGFRLARARLADVAAPSRQLLVPARAVVELGRLLGEAETARLIPTPEGRGVHLAVGETTLFARLGEGRFPDVERVIPPEGTTRVTVDTAAFRQAIRVAGPFGGGGDPRPVVLDAAPGRLQVRARSDETGEAEADLPGEVEGTPQAIVVNTRLLADALSDCPRSEDRMTTLPSQMTALLAREQDQPPERMLSLEERPLPEPQIGDVLIQVGAGSFTPTELRWPSTWVDRSGRDRRPVIPGHEVSGTVVALGYSAAGLGVGDEVFGLTDWYRDGSLAKFAAVEARDLASKPGSVSHVDAAAFPMAALTAWQALFVHAHLQAGQTVVIHGAGGGVGTTAVQLAVHAGARVIGTGRPNARDLVLQLGAEQYLDLAHDALGDVKGVDVVFDLIGGEVLHRSGPTLRPGGSLVSVVEAPTAERADVNCVFFVVEPNREQLTELARRIDSESLRPVVGTVGALSDGARLWAEKIAGVIPGKVVLTPGSPAMR
jgi:NADPH:quinone reductase-like Zn-dependent oxidoreductase